MRRNCLLKYIIEGKVEGRVAVTRRREKRRQQILDDLIETKESLKFKEGYTLALLVEALSYRLESHGFDSRWGHSEFSLT